MIIFKKAEAIGQYLKNLECSGKKTGFVPTMGALHQGHLSLIEQSREKSDLTICSIFINPRQFNNSNDLQQYPVTLEEDIRLLEQSGCDLLFIPSPEEIYPPDYQAKTYPLGQLEQVLEGEHRPGHFQGVCAVVERLLHIIPCDTLFLGEKDFQQCLVIKKLLEIMDEKIELNICPTLRETDGLAMSSRNLRLNPKQRVIAAALYKALHHIAHKKDHATLLNNIDEAKQMIAHAGFQLDYLKVCDEHLHELNSFHPNTKAIALVAASLDGIRLIDNMTISTLHEN